MAMNKYIVVVEQINKFYIEAESEEEAGDKAAADYIWDADQKLPDRYEANITVYDGRMY
tara:strand:+ start:2201 stop:2377 length:177 start_codon:yes stop_codon:yes gene_type:complete